MDTAVENPKGEGVDSPLMSLPPVVIGEDPGRSASTSRVENGKGGGLATILSRREGRVGLSKKDKKRLGKEKIQDKQRANAYWFDTTAKRKAQVFAKKHTCCP